MVLNPDDPNTLKGMAARVLRLADEADLEIEDFSHIAEVCFTCDQLAERPASDPERMDAVEWLRDIVQYLTAEDDKD